MPSFLRNPSVRKVHKILLKVKPRVELKNEGDTEAGAGDRDIGGRDMLRRLAKSEPTESLLRYVTREDGGSWYKTWVRERAREQNRKVVPPKKVVENEKWYQTWRERVRERPARLKAGRQDTIAKVLYFQRGEDHDIPAPTKAKEEESHSPEEKLTAEPKSNVLSMERDPIFVRVKRARQAAEKIPNRHLFKKMAEEFYKRYSSPSAFMSKRILEEKTRNNDQVRAKIDKISREISKKGAPLLKEEKIKPHIMTTEETFPDWNPVKIASAQLANKKNLLYQRKVNEIQRRKRMGLPQEEQSILNKTVLSYSYSPKENKVKKPEHSVFQKQGLATAKESEQTSKVVKSDFINRSQNEKSKDKVFSKQQKATHEPMSMYQRLINSIPKSLTLKVKEEELEKGTELDKNKEINNIKGAENKELSFKYNKSNLINNLITEEKKINLPENFDTMLFSTQARLKRPREKLFVRYINNEREKTLMTNEKKSKVADIEINPRKDVKLEKAKEAELKELNMYKKLISESYKNEASQALISTSQKTEGSDKNTVENLKKNENDSELMEKKRIELKDSNSEEERTFVNMVDGAKKEEPKITERKENVKSSQTQDKLSDQGINKFINHMLGKTEYSPESIRSTIGSSEFGSERRELILPERESRGRTIVEQRVEKNAFQRLLDSGSGIEKRLAEGKVKSELNMYQKLLESPTMKETSLHSNKSVTELDSQEGIIATIPYSEKMKNPSESQDKLKKDDNFQDKAPSRFETPTKFTAPLERFTEVDLNTGKKENLLFQKKFSKLEQKLPDQTIGKKLSRQSATSKTKILTNKIKEALSKTEPENIKDSNYLKESITYEKMEELFQPQVKVKEAVTEEDAVKLESDMVQLPSSPMIYNRDDADLGISIYQKMANESAKRLKLKHCEEPQVENGQLQSFSDVLPDKLKKSLNNQEENRQDKRNGNTTFPKIDKTFLQSIPAIGDLTKFEGESVFMNRRTPRSTISTRSFVRKPQIRTKLSQHKLQFIP